MLHAGADVPLVPLVSTGGNRAARFVLGRALPQGAVSAHTAVCSLE